MRNIEEYFKYIYSLERSSMKYDLNNIKKLLEYSGNPHLRTKFIHIAGTNGKGGTASFLASMLMEHGLKTGLFTSPHILKFNERIRINGKTIEYSFIKNYLDENKGIIRKIKPSFFEVNTALAFKYFADNKIDIGIVEAGLGGRLDSTNIIKPELVIITQIEIDHTDYLGNRIKDIALEKLGIVKSGTDVIVSDDNDKLKKLFRSKIEKYHLFFLDENVKTDFNNGSNGKGKLKFELKAGEILYDLYVTSPLPGSYQHKNISAALLAAFKYLVKNNIKPVKSKLKRAIEKIKENTGYRCRFETVRLNGINYIFDVSHNASGIKSALSNLTNSESNIIIFAMMSDKDYKSSIKYLLRTGSTVIFTQPEYKRAISSQILYNFAKRNQFGKSSEIHLTGNVKDAIKLSRKYNAGKANVIFIGSFFLVSEAIRNLRMQKKFS